MMARAAGSKNTKRRIDPLIAALIGTLPPPGTAWPLIKRNVWLEMAEKAFEMVYGVPDEDHSFEADMKRRTMSEYAGVRADPASSTNAQKPAEHAFYIDREGYARIAGGDRINAVEVDGQLFDLRGEGDLGAIIWADGSTGVLGKVLDIKPA